MKLSTFLLISILIVIGCPAVGQTASSDLDKKVGQIHKKIFTVDSHTDTPLQLMSPGFDMSKHHDAVKDHSKIDFPRMKEGGLDGAFFGVFVSQGKRTPEGYYNAMKRADAIIDSIYEMLARHPDEAGLAVSPADGYKLKRHGRQAIFIGMENGYPIGNDLSLVKYFYVKGVRYITLCHTRNNDICDSSTDSTEFGGLSDYGKNVVKYMNKTGMMVDVSHISDRAFCDVLSVSKAPVIASHSCARALCDNPRNMDDDMLRALAKNGGVIQMCILSAYVKKQKPYPARDSAVAALRKKFRNFDNLSKSEREEARKAWDALDDIYPQELATVSDVVDHIDHIVKIAGIDHVGIGTDFDGGGGVKDCFDVSQMKNITRELVKRGYSTSDIRKIWGGNLFRVMKKVKKVARKLDPPCNC
ncbi:MAG: dipeptidase [Bacteroidetes bacterium]|nr:dipeptidase [Bacteroidota bacterium]